MAKNASRPRPPSPPHRILAIGHDAGLGGAQLSLLDILARLDPARYRPLLVVPTPGPFVAAARKRGFPCWWGVTLRWVFFRKRDFAARPWRLLVHPWLWAAVSLATLPMRLAVLAVLAKTSKIDMIYSNTVTVADGALLARLLGLPHVWHLREAVDGNRDLDFPWPVPALPAFILKHSRRVIVNSDALRQRLFGDSSPESLRVIWNGVDLGATDAEPAMPLPADIPAQARLAGICGKLSTRKGVDVYLRAAARLAPDFPDLHHLVIGEGTACECSKLKLLAAELGIADRIHFLGYRKDAATLFAHLVVLVSASTNEPFGRTLVEAMAQGVPVVSTRSGGPEEIVEDCKSGFLVDVGDAEAIAERTARLLSDPALAASFGAAGLLRAHEHFDVRRMVARVQHVFDEAMAD